ARLPRQNSKTRPPFAHPSSSSPPDPTRGSLAHRALDQYPDMPSPPPRGSPVPLRSPYPDLALPRSIPHTDQYVLPRRALQLCLSIIHHNCLSSWDVSLSFLPYLPLS